MLEKKHNLTRSDRRIQPRSIYSVIETDPLSPLSPEWRSLERADQDRWTKHYLLPLIRVICLLLSWLLLIIKRVIPLPLGSQTLLNWLSRYFMMYFVAPEAQQMLYRHFSVENALIFFIIQNSGDADIQSVNLRPNCPEQLGDVAGTNATLLHDRIIIDLFADLAGYQQADTTSKIPLSELNFSGLDLPEFKVYQNNRGRLINLDFESSLYLTVLVISLCFTRQQIDSAVGSLFLDNSLMKCLANLTDDNCFRQWHVYAPGEHLHIPLNPAAYLYRHILIHEFAYYRLQKLQEQS